MFLDQNASFCLFLMNKDTPLPLDLLNSKFDLKYLGISENIHPLVVVLEGLHIVFLYCIKLIRDNFIAAAVDHFHIDCVRTFCQDPKTLELYFLGFLLDLFFDSCGIGVIV
jgi:hypothetical protein